MVDSGAGDAGSSSIPGAEVRSVKLYPPRSVDKSIRMFAPADPSVESVSTVDVDVDVDLEEREQEVSSSSQSVFSPLNHKSPPLTKHNFN